MENFTSRSQLFEAGKPQAIALTSDVDSNDDFSVAYATQKLSVPVNVLSHDRYIVEELPDGSFCKCNDVRLFLQAQNSASLYGDSYLNRQSTTVGDPVAPYAANLTDDELLAAVTSRYENGQKSDMMRRSESEQRYFREHIDAMVAAAQQAQAQSAAQPVAADKVVEPEK